MASIDFKADGSAQHGVPLNMSSHIDIDLCHTCLKYCHKISVSPGAECINVPLQVSPQEKSIGIRSSEGGHVTGPRRPINLHGHFAFNHCRMSSTQYVGAASCRNQILCLTTVGTSADPVEQFPAACQVADKGPRQCPQRFERKRWGRNKFHTTFADCMRILPRPEVTAVDAEHSLTLLSTKFCAKNILWAVC